MQKGAWSLLRLWLRQAWLRAKIGFFTAEVDHKLRHYRRGK